MTTPDQFYPPLHDSWSCWSSWLTRIPCALDLYPSHVHPAHTSIIRFRRRSIARSHLGFGVPLGSVGWMLVRASSAHGKKEIYCCPDDPLPRDPFSSDRQRSSRSCSHGGIQSAAGSASPTARCTPVRKRRRSPPHHASKPRWKQHCDGTAALTRPG